MLKSTDSETSSRTLGASRVVCVYENQSLSTRSSYAVPRLASQVLEHFAAVDRETEFIAISTESGNIAGVRNLVAQPGQLSRLRTRVFHSRLTKALPFPRGIETMTPYQRARSAMHGLAPQVDSQTVVICLTFTTAILARKMLPGAKVVYWIHSLPRIGQETMAIQAINSADIVVASSRAIYSDMFQLACRDRFEPPVWVIPNCTDQELFCRLSEDAKEKVRERLGLKTDDVAIAHVGRAPEKGLKVAEMALSLLNGGTKNIVLVSAGGRHKGRRRISANVEVLETGRVTPDELNEMYQVCDLGLVPSVWWENCPLALVEMMSLGLCPIGSRVGGISEMIDHNKNGLLVDAPNDVAAWAAAIDRIVKDDELRKRLGNEAAKSVDGRFSHSQFMDKWESVINLVSSKV